MCGEPEVVGRKGVEVLFAFIRWLRRQGAGMEEVFGEGDKG